MYFFLFLAVIFFPIQSMSSVDEIDKSADSVKIGVYAYQDTIFINGDRNMPYLSFNFNIEYPLYIENKIIKEKYFEIFFNNLIA